MKRFTETCKWSDVWFRKLTPVEKAVWFYLCDNCNAAGIIEVDVALSAFQVGCSPAKIEGALKGLGRGLLGAERQNLYMIRTFLKHQKNSDLNPKNKAHLQILRILGEYKNDFPEFYKLNKEKIEGASKGLTSPIGIGIGIGIVNDDDDGGEPKIEDQSDEFNQFWEAYPKKKAKVDARKAFKQVKPPLDVILKEIDSLKNTPDWQKSGGQYIPLPASWLRGERWTDEGVTQDRFIQNGQNMAGEPLCSGLTLKQWNAKYKGAQNVST